MYTDEEIQTLLDSLEIIIDVSTHGQALSNSNKNSLDKSIKDVFVLGHTLSSVSKNMNQYVMPILLEKYVLVDVLRGKAKHIGNPVLMNMLFHEPLESTPLHINDMEYGSIAKWRLKIGR